MLNSGLILDLLGRTGTHQQKIEDFFDGSVQWTGIEPAIQKPLIVLAFSNRSGSNYLAELIRSTDQIVGLGEALNADTVIKRCKDWGVRSFPEYFQSLNEGKSRPFGVKASWDQLLMLQRFRISEMHTGMKVIHIYRRDVIGQAISREIAWQTGKWTSLTPVPDPVAPSYNQKRVTQELASVLMAEAAFPLIFEAFGLDVVHVSYEGLVNDPTGTVRDTLSSIGFPVAEWTHQETRIKKQADATNEDFRRNYRAMLLERCLTRRG
jgi:LPS sulfotransferase NodH